MMSETRYRAVSSGLSSIARKVYDATPISEAWTMAKIMSELMRIGTPVTHKVVGGCLSTLISAGLVTEPERGVFVRAPIRQTKTAQDPEIKTVAAIAAPQPITKEPELPAPTTKPAQNPIDKLSALSARVEMFACQIKELANDITSVAIEIEEQTANDKADLEKLRQLQNILKGLG